MPANFIKVHPSLTLLTLIVQAAAEEEAAVETAVAVMAVVGHLQAAQVVVQVGQADLVVLGSLT